MRALPDGVETNALIEALEDGWGFGVETIEYAPVGFGSYHWDATDAAGTRRFVTVDDLDRKPWLGDDRQSVLDGLIRAYGSAVALQAGGLEFVLAPIPMREGEPLHRLGSRHTVALFPFVAGRAGRNFQYDTPEDRAAVLALFARLHQATTSVDSIASRIDLDLPGRGHLVSGLEAVGRTWTGGPLSEPARKELARHASEVAELLDLFDRLAGEVAASDEEWVVTHGEPHAGNVIRCATGRRLVDWDTVAVGPRERDLWLLVADENDATAYAQATGHRPDRRAMDLFRLTWDLKDLAAYIEVLRSPHREDDDTRLAFQGLRRCVTIRERFRSMV
jgi:spectinomycin phosphotransferase